MNYNSQNLGELLKSDDFKTLIMKRRIEVLTSTKEYRENLEKLDRSDKKLLVNTLYGFLKSTELKTLSDDVITLLCEVADCSPDFIKCEDDIFVKWVDSYFDLDSYEYKHELSKENKESIKYIISIYDYFNDIDSTIPDKYLLDPDKCDVDDYKFVFEISEMHFNNFKDKCISNRIISLIKSKTFRDNFNKADFGIKCMVHKAYNDILFRDNSTTVTDRVGSVRGAYEMLELGEISLDFILCKDKEYMEYMEKFKSLYELNDKYRIVDKKGDS